MKKEEKQLIVVTDEEKQVKGIGTITAFIEEAKKIQKKMEESTIIDENSSVVMDNQVKAAKKLKKQLNDKKLAMTEEWRNNTKLVNDLANRIMEPIQGAIDTGGQKVVKWKEQEEKKRQAELQKAREKQKRLDEINATILTAMDEFNQEVAECKDLQELTAISNGWVNPKRETSWYSKFLAKTEEFPELRDKIVAIRTSMMMVGKATRQKLEAQAAGDAKKAKEIEKQTEEIANHESEKIQAEAISSDNTELVNVSADVATLEKKKTKGIRKTWTYEVESKEDIPLKFLTIDHSAVQLYIKQNKDKEMNVPGLRFYQKSVHVS